MNDTVRLNKIISNAGICSRRCADKLIAAGRVRVNAVIVTNLGAVADIKDKIEVDNKLINTASQARLWIYYKPVGLLTTNFDPYNRPTIFENLQDLPRVISIGRLDLNSEGLLLLTNNGDLARKFELPSTNLQRVYKVRAYGNHSKLLPYLNRKFTIKIQDVIYNIDNITIAQHSRLSLEIEFRKRSNRNNWFICHLSEGKNREIRKVFTYFGLEVSRLIRTNYGPFSLENLKPGKYQEQAAEKFAKYML